MKIHLVHGIHNSGLNVACHRLIPYLETIGPTVVYPDYGFILGIESRRINPIVVGSILPYIEPGDIMVGHSNGCAIIYDLIVAGAPIAGAVFINAALKADIDIPPQLQWFEVFYNEGDDVTQIAKIAAALELVDQCWGEMGHSGYSGSDPRCTGNWDCGAGAPTGFPMVHGHAEIFDPAALAGWGPFCADRIRSHLIELPESVRKEDVPAA